MGSMGTRMDPKDVIVSVYHNWGKAEMTLEEWIATGPGVRRHRHPVEPRERSTGRPLPMSAIPLQYRNSRASRLLIRLGLLDDPWPADKREQ